MVTFFVGVLNFDFLHLLRRAPIDTLDTGNVIGIEVASVRSVKRESARTTNCSSGFKLMVVAHHRTLKLRGGLPQKDETNPCYVPVREQARPIDPVALVA